MRPRKRILLLAEHEAQRDRLTLVLDIWRFAVVTAEQCETVPPDAVLVQAVGLALIPSAVQQFAGVSVVAIVAREQDRRSALGQGAKYATTQALELREYLHLATACKRGPKRATSIVEVAA